VDSALKIRGLFAEIVASFDALRPVDVQRVGPRIEIGIDELERRQQTTHPSVVVSVVRQCNDFLVAELLPFGLCRRVRSQCTTSKFSGAASVSTSESVFTVSIGMVPFGDVACSNAKKPKMNSDASPSPSSDLGLSLGFQIDTHFGPLRSRKTRS